MATSTEKRGSLLRELPLLNIRRAPFRSVCAALLIALLSFALLLGIVLLRSFQKGLESAGNRFGADLTVVPEGEADAYGDILVQGASGYFYMDKGVVDQVREVPGVAEATPQFYLTSMSSECCSTAVQIIGFDPSTDFVLKPWIRETYSGSLTSGQVVIAGSDVQLEDGNALTFFGHDFPVTARLSKTGTGLDSAVFTDMGTIRTLMGYAADKQFEFLDEADPDKAVSAVLVDVEGGYDAQAVENAIKEQVGGIDTVRASGILSRISDSLGSMGRVATALLSVLFLTSFVILVVLYGIISESKKRDFATLSLLGLDQRGIRREYLAEALIQSVGGSLTGLAVAGVILVSFQTAIRLSVGLPYLQLSAGELAVTVLAVFAVTALTGPAAAALYLRKIDRVDASLLLRRWD